MSKASRNTYLEELTNGNLTKNGVYVLDYIKKNGKKHTGELRDELTLPHQTLTSRLSVLLDFGLIKVVETKEVIFNGRKKTFSVYEFEKDELKQVNLQILRHKIKAKNWLKSYDKYKDVLCIKIVNL